MERKPRTSILLLSIIILVVAVLALSLVHNYPFSAQPVSSLKTHILPTSTPTSSQVTINLAVRPTQATVATPRPTAIQPAPIISTILPPGAPLPGEAECAARVQRSSFEPRPQNYAANHRVPTAAQLAGLDPKQNKYARQITGNFVGTTDEILQWVACKWGMDPDIVRAQAVVESYWIQSTKGGTTTNQSICAPGTWDGKACYQYFGLLQLTYQYWKTAWPMMRDDSAFSGEYIYGLIRNCYDGGAGYTNTPAPGYPSYRAGDIWGCMGAWYSGQWYPQNAMDYISAVKHHYANKTWQQKGF